MEDGDGPEAAKPEDGYRQAAALTRTANVQARSALRAAAKRVGKLVSLVEDGTRPVPLLEWNVAETAAHLVLMGRDHLDWATGRSQPDGRFEDVAAMNRDNISRFDERDPQILAELIDETWRTYLTATANRLPTESIRWFEGCRISNVEQTGILLGEMLVHGLDLARAMNLSWEISRPDALIVIQSLAPVLPYVVNKEQAAGVVENLDIRLRGGDSMTLHFNDGSLSVEPGSHGPVTCHVSADPVTFLLLSYGRIGPWEAGRRGGIFSWGRKPWAAFKLTGLLNNP